MKFVVVCVCILEKHNHISPQTLIKSKCELVCLSTGESEYTYILPPLYKLTGCVKNQIQCWFIFALLPLFLYVHQEKFENVILVATFILGAGSFIWQ